MPKRKRYQPEGFSGRLRELWLASGLTQLQIAERIGWDRKSVIGWIYGERIPDVLAFARLCRLFNVSADYLLFGKEKDREECGADNDAF